VTLAHLKIVGVMGRGNFHAACSKFLVHIRVGDNRNLPVCQRQLKHLAHDVLIALILRVHRNRGVSQHGFRPCGGYLHKTARLSHYRIIDVPEKAVLLHMLHLCIRDRGLAYRTPVNDSGPLINVAFLVQLDKDLQNRVRAAMVHGKTLPVPVSR